jgi:sugar-specific transcriptional regulator TrmB
MQIQEVLEYYGLNKKQAIIYLACLKLGSSSVYYIAENAKLPRTTCYEILEDLKDLGLVSTYKKKSVIYYSIEDPNEIIVNAKEKLNKLELAMPQLRSMYSNIKNKPTVRLFEGEVGMKKILQEINNEAKEVKGFSSAENLFSVVEDYLPIYRKERIKNKIPAKMLMPESPMARERQKIASSQLREVRILPESFKPDGLVVIWNDKVATFSFGKEMTALIITSKELAHTQTMMFDYIWNSLKE